MELLDRLNKRLKKLIKTIREISDLEEREASRKAGAKVPRLIPEQVEKISKKSEYDAERLEVEELIASNSNADDSAAAGASGGPSAFEQRVSSMRLKLDEMKSKQASLQELILATSETINTLTLQSMNMGNTPAGSAVSNGSGVSRPSENKLPASPAASPAASLPVPPTASASSSSTASSATAAAAGPRPYKPPTSAPKAVKASPYDNIKPAAAPVSAPVPPPPAVNEDEWAVVPGKKKGGKK